MSEIHTPDTCPICGGPRSGVQCPACDIESTAYADSEPTKPIEKVIRLRTLRIWLILILIILGMISAGIYALELGDRWEHRVPSSILLLLADSSRPSVASELVDRLDRNELTEDQIVKVLKLRMGEPKLEIRSPYPSDIEQFATLNVPLRLSAKRWEVVLEDINLEINGEKVSDARQMRMLFESDFNAASGRQIRLPPLEEGEYELSIGSALRITDLGRPMDSRPQIRIPIVQRHLLSIKGVVEDYIELVENEAVIDDVRKGTRARIQCTDIAGQTDYMLILMANDIPVGLAASVWTRAGGTFEFYRIGTFVRCCPGTSPGHPSKAYQISGLPRIKRAKRVEVRLVTDVQQALEKKMKNCFSGEINWTDVTIKRPPGTNWSIVGPWASPDEVSGKQSGTHQPETDEVMRRGI